MEDDTISVSTVLDCLTNINTLDKGLNDNIEKDDGIYETHWWDIPPEDVELLRNTLHKHNIANATNISLRPKHTSHGPHADGTHRLSVTQCTIPVPPNEYNSKISDQHEEDRAEYYRDKHEAEQE